MLGSFARHHADPLIDPLRVLVPPFCMPLSSIVWSMTQGWLLFASSTLPGHVKYSSTQLMGHTVTVCSQAHVRQGPKPQHFLAMSQVKQREGLTYAASFDRHVAPAGDAGASLTAVTPHLRLI